jgi:ABC-type branched-subunit amino acid transport system ATPase component/MFS family permease
MTSHEELEEVRTAETAIEVLERDALELRDGALAAVGFESGGSVPSLREGIRRAGAGWSTAVGLSVLALPVIFLNLIFLMFDPAIANTLGLDPLGYEHPGFLNSFYVPMFMVGIAIAGFFTAWLVFRRRWRGWVVVVSAFGYAAGLWLASFATVEWGLVIAVLVAGLALGARFSAGVSLLMDSYPPELRVRVITLYVLGIAAGSVLGGVVIAVGVDSWSLTWRGVLMILAGIASLTACASLVVRDRGVGRYDLDRIDELVRDRVGERGSADAELSEAEVAIGFGEQLRQLFATRSATAMVIVFLVFGTFAVPLQAFVGQFVIARYAWTLNDRAWLYTGLTAVALLPLFVLFARGDAWFCSDPPRVMRYAARFALLSTVSLFVVAFVADEIVTVVGLALAYLGAYLVLAVAYVVMLSVVDPRLRPHAAALSGVIIASAVLAGGVLPGQLSDRYGVTAALVFFALNFLAVGGAMRTAAGSMRDDLVGLVEAETQREELRVRVSTGQHFPLLGCRNIDFSYGKLQVLFGVDFTVDDGEMVALLGTNGAGKSTLLKIISGIGIPSRGSVHYRGADITYVDPVRRVQHGITQMPGGRSVFGTMTVAENLRMYGFSVRKTKHAIERGIDATFEAFPGLAGRRNQHAATLSGGEQQMLSLGKAFILQPRLLLIDELSLGLAPLIVGQLIDMVRRINDSGTAVVLVEQSVNIALTLVDHAYFMERGEVRFDGVASELIERPDLLRSVFLEGASQGLRAMVADAAGNHT